jgi:hypothetical protein
VRILSGYSTLSKSSEIWISSDSEFKLFVKDAEEGQRWGNNIVSKMMGFTVSKVSNLNEPLDIISKHHYGYNSQSIYGSDKLLLDRLSEEGFKVDLQPVLIRLTGRGADFFPEWEHDKAYVECAVYSITEEALQLVKND